MLPSFLSDINDCRTQPTAEKAYLLWGGNAGNVFYYPVLCDLPFDEWKELSGVYSRMPGVLDACLATLEDPDSTQAKRLRSIKADLTAYQPFYAITDALYAGQLDSAFARLALAFSEGKTPLQYLSLPLRKLIYGYGEAGNPGQALALLDIASRSTREDDLSRDSLRLWYHGFDPAHGDERLEKMSDQYDRPLLIPTEKRIELSGHYSNLATGEPFDLATLRGKDVLFDFWTTWCKPCAAEIPELNEFSKKCIERSDFTFVAMSSDAVEGGAGESDVKAFVKKNGIRYLTLYDHGDSSLTRQFGVSGWPAKFFVNQQGEIMKNSQDREALTIKLVEEYLKRKR